MGVGSSSRAKPPNVPFPQYPGPQGTAFPPVSTYPPANAYPPYNISRPGSPMMSNMGEMAALNRRQQRKLEEANRTIQTLQNQMGGRPPSPYPYGGPPVMNAPPMPYNPMMGQNSYPPPSPILQRAAAQSQYPYQQQLAMGSGGAGGYRDNDYAAVANIAGLNPGDVALLHREYTNLTRGGTNKIDRVVFRQLLREAMVEANNENIDRAIENIFISIDRNRDGFIDFPEFVGAFRDILRGSSIDSQNYFNQPALPDLIHDQIRGNPFGNSNFLPQSSSSGQFLSMPSSNAQQSPLVYSGASPLVISLDSNQSPYMINPQGQSTTLQCIPLPI